MVFTILCIFCTTLLGILFRFSSAFNVRTSVIILVNYITCFIIGLIWNGNKMLHQFSIEWIPWILGLGLLFILGFNAFANAIRSSGLPIAALFQKMSIVITVLAALLLGDPINTIQLVGWTTGIFAIVLVYATNTESAISPFNFKTLIATLIISSAIEIGFLLLSKASFLNPEFHTLFPGYLFLSAALFGIAAFSISNQRIKISKPEISFGIALGLPNFFSIYFMLKALKMEWSGVAFFPVLNCSVIIASALSGYYLFKDSLTSKLIIAILLSTISILLISLF